MKKHLFLALLSLVLSISLNAEEVNALYGDYVNCYYELNQYHNYAGDFLLNRGNFVGHNNVAFSRERLSKISEYKQLLKDTDYDVYVFSYEGLFGLKINEGYKNITDLFVGTEEKPYLAYDFSIKAHDSVYDLCYFKEMTRDTEEGKTYIEEVYTGNCYSNNIISENLLYKVQKLDLRFFNDSEKTIFKAEKLNSSYFYTTMLLDLQKTFSWSAEDYIWSLGYAGNICADSQSRSIYGEFRDIPEDIKKFNADYLERMENFNNIVNKKDCYSACKKIGAITEIKDTKKKGRI